MSLTTILYCKQNNFYIPVTMQGHWEKFLELTSGLVIVFQQVMSVRMYGGMRDLHVHMQE